jgi:aryl-alcohol dehydrogenase-like predicted oxidoreductase
MNTRMLGINGPQVPAIGLGCMGFSEFYAASTASEAELLAQDPHNLPIPGTTSLQRLEENLAAASITLGVNDLARIAAAAPPGVAAGARYDETGMRSVNG